MKNTFEEKLYQLKIEREMLLSIFKSLDITHIEDKEVESMRNIDMKDFIINQLKNRLSYYTFVTVSNQ